MKTLLLMLVLLLPLGCFAISKSAPTTEAELKDEVVETTYASGKVAHGKLGKCWLPGDC